MRSLLPPTVGVVAILVTTAFTALQGILIASVSSADAVRTTAIVSAITQVVVLLFVASLCIAHALDSLATYARRHTSLIMGFGIILSTLAAVVSVATLVLLSNAGLDPEIDGISKTTLLIASAVLIGTAYPLQLIFLVLQFIMGRKSTSAASSSTFPRVKSPSGGSKLKSIPYNQTNVSIEKRQGNNSMDAPSVATSAAGSKSGVETSGSVSSRTRLLPLREKKRPASLESMANRSSTEDTFESWDTSSVDAHNKQTIFDLSSSPPAPQKPPRFLETIPASPTGSRSPSPAGSSIDLAPPRRARRRSRSYSPASSRRVSISSLPNSSEAHIHPLFRSDSTEPPPVATPGTSVVASPIAGQVISPRPSMRSLNRMRSGSLPTAPSPLSRQSSFEDGVAKRLQDEQGSIKEEREDAGLADDDDVRKMTPPIPDWIMSAGNRSSLNDYKRRTVKDGEAKATSPMS